MQTILNCLNKTIKCDKQLSLSDFGGNFDTFSSKEYENDFSSIFNNLDINLEGFTYYVVAYGFSNNKVTSMDCYLLSSDFNIVEKSSIMKYINPDYISLTLHDSENQPEVANQGLEEEPKKGIKLGLKQNPKKKES